MQHMHTFGHPVYALERQLASGNSIPIWAPRCCLGLNLGASPHHACNVNLVLNFTNGCVSQQYHCHFDDFFETTCLNQADFKVSISWKVRARFVKYDEGNPIEHHYNSVQRNFVMPVEDKGDLEASLSDGPDDIIQNLNMDPPGHGSLPSHAPHHISQQPTIPESEGATPPPSADTSS